MSNLEPNQLDDLLRDWAAEARPAPNHLATLQQQILDQWEVEQQTVAPAPTAPEQRPESRSMLAVGVALGALAMALIVLLWSSAQVNHKTDIAGNRDKQPPPEFAWLSDAQLADKKILRDEMLTMFDQKFGWIAETGDNLEIGLDGRQVAGESPAVAVRVIVERRNVGDRDWKTIWAVDVVTLSEERIEFTPKSPDFTGFRLWAYALPDGMVAVDTELDQQSNPILITEHLQRDGKPDVIYQTRSGQEEIRVLQAAAVL